MCTCCRYQIVDFPNMNTTQVDNGTWQVGDYVDTLLMPEFASEARVRWIPGPINITGGQAAPAQPARCRPQSCNCYN